MAIIAMIIACVKSAFYTKREGKRIRTGISLFQFSIKDNERRKWINGISPYGRNGFGDTYNPLNKNKNTLFVNFTFKLEDIPVSLRIDLKTLKPGIVPSIFKFKNHAVVKPRKSRKTTNSGE